jgi:hemerythrin superfamily protein
MEIRMTSASKQSTRSESTTKSKASSAKADALAKLKADHAAAKKLFDQYEKSKDDMSNEEKQAIVAEICLELTVHAQIEEEIFYPAVREVADDDLDELLDEAEVEHTGAKDLVAQLDEASPEDELYDAKVTVLGEQVKHHAGEEENEMFPKVRKTELDLVELGAELEQRSKELKASGGGK